MPEAANNAFVGRVYLARGDGGSPENFNRVCQVFGMSGIGQKNALVDITTFCSDGVMEYAAGLSDGSEITFELNFETQSAQIAGMIADVQAKATRDFSIEIEGTTAGVTDCTIDFAAKALSWELKPSVASKNTISFGCKITGDVQFSVPGIDPVA